MSPFYPVNEYARPWKVITLVIGMLFLFAGARWSGLPDWDIGVSLLMGWAAYLFAPDFMHIMIGRRWAYMPIALFGAWFTVDGLYLLYWYLKDPAVLLFRPANAAASSALFLMCGLVWYPKAPLHLVARRLRITRT